MQKNGTELLAALNAGGLQPQTEQDILAKNAHTALMAFLGCINRSLRRSLFTSRWIIPFYRVGRL